MTYLHQQSLSPDPTYGRETSSHGDNQQTAMLYPQSLLRAWPASAATASWGEALDMFRAPPPLELLPGFDRRAGLFVDFGTELDAELILEVKTTSLVNVLVWRGESVPEAEGWVRDGHPQAMTSRHIPGQGLNTLTIPALGFRFVRIEFHDLAGPIRILKIAANALWTFRRRDGDFHCSDPRFQRVWQTSAYTARLCTRPDTYWDGIKRDRVGWFGDGRIIKEATDQVFFDPRPAESMLLSLPTDKWANGIPNYSFDAIAMLRAHVLRYGLGRDCVRPAFQKIVEMLTWARKTQTNADGFIIRTDGTSYCFNTGFIDWSEFPLGGRHEELGWLQATYLAGLRNAVNLASWLGEETQVSVWESQAAALAERIQHKFWREGVGYIHTLNHVGEASNPHHPFIAYRDWHTKRTYEDGIRLGPSGPSRQVNAYAILAGLGDTVQRSLILEKVFDNQKIPPVITPYFAYYEQRARALCGDLSGALRVFRDYIGNMLETEDAATIWEYYIPSVRDLRRFASSLDIDFDWPTSLCHGWGAGAVPLTTEFLLGIRPIAPGFRQIELNPVAELPWSYQALVPTPFGPITVEKAADGNPHYCIPREIGIQAISDSLSVEKVG